MQSERQLAKIITTRTDKGVTFVWDGPIDAPVAIDDTMVFWGVLQLLPWKLVPVDDDPFAGVVYYMREEYAETDQE